MPWENSQHPSTTHQYSIWALENVLNNTRNSQWKYFEIVNRSLRDMWVNEVYLCLPKIKESIFLMSNTLTWLWMGYILTRQVVLISRFCIVYSTILARLPRHHFLSLHWLCLVTRLQRKLRCSLAILIWTNQKVRWGFRLSLRVTFKIHYLQSSTREG